MSVKQLGVVLFTALFLVIPLQPSQACDALEALYEPIDLERVETDGVIVTGNGDRLVLASVLMPEPPTQPNPVAASLAGLTRGTVLEAAVLGSPDRWGRKPAAIAIRRKEGLIEDLSTSLVAAGTAIAWPKLEQDDPCFAERLEVEALARLGKRGLWAGKVILLDDSSAALQPDAVGRPVLATGRVDAVVFRGTAIYINFGRNWRGRLSVVVQLPKDRAERESLVDGVKMLAGRKVLIRGIVEAGRSTPRLLIRDVRQIQIDDETLN